MRYVSLFVSLWLAGCGHEEREKKNRPATVSPVSVGVVAVAPVEWSVQRESVGTVRARTTGSVSPRITAYVREVRVNTGDMVRAGQVLVVLDSKDLESAQRQAEEAQREARGAEAEVESAIRGAKAQLDLARVTFGRMTDLYGKKSISNQEFDEAQARVKLAEANHDMAQSKRAQWNARMAQASEAVKNAGIQRGYSEILAPFAGMVVARHVEPGNLASPGTPLLEVEQGGAYRLEVPVDESLLPSLRRGQRVGIVLEALGRSLEAPITEIVPAVDAAARSVTVKLDLPGITGLRSGMSARAAFGSSAVKTLVIPASAMRTEGSLQIVFSVDQGQARSRLITTGAKRDGQLEVLAGLTEGEKIIHPLPPALADGVPVEVRP